MKHITYLFGAGASANALPINERLLIDMIHVSHVINSAFESNKGAFVNDPNEPNIKYNVKKLIEDFNWLAKECSRHLSVDTFAKKLFITKNLNDLNRLKSILVYYFVIKQSNNYDSRYDSFWASLFIDPVKLFPKNLNLLSWNYDSQLELSLSPYLSNSHMNVHELLNVNGEYQKPIDSLSLYNINGSAKPVVYGNKKNTYNEHFSFDSNDPKSVAFLSKMYDDFNNTSLVTSGVNFAWETNDEILFKIKNATIKTKILVVIGYSFPFFNRSIDREIIRNMEDLEKVYLQSPEAEEIQESFLAIRDDITDKKFHLFRKTNQFVMPREL